MTNPFQAFNISDDEETFQPVEQKVKRTHQEKRVYKQQQEAAKVTVTQTQPVVTEPLPERIRENAKEVRNTRAPPTPQSKKLGEGHYLDRRSGTGRVDKPRKQGGGWGNIGNIKDQFKKDKYLKQTPEENQVQGQVPVEGEQKTTEEVVVEQKPEQPKALTLQQYYKNKGVEINNTFQKKVVVRKGELNADWIKKEKLTVLESKEDKKISERNTQNVVKFSSSRVGLDQNLESLGFFGQKTAPKQEQKREHKPQYKGKGKGKGKKEAVIQEQDFPTLGK